jgi:hypothetical protein
MQTTGAASPPAYLALARLALVVAPVVFMSLSYTLMRAALTPI